jgi:hypothetical protein
MWTLLFNRHDLHNAELRLNLTYAPLNSIPSDHLTYSCMKHYFFNIAVVICNYHGYTVLRWVFRWNQMSWRMRRWRVDNRRTILICWIPRTIFKNGNIVYSKLVMVSQLAINGFDLIWFDLIHGTVPCTAHHLVTVALWHTTFRYCNNSTKNI